VTPTAGISTRAWWILFRRYCCCRF